MFAIKFAKMKFILTDHAKYRLMERGIDFSQIKKIIKNDSRTNQVLGAKLVARGSSNDGRPLEVVFKQWPKGQFVIMTAYYDN